MPAPQGRRTGVTSDWRNRIESAAPEEKEAVIAQAVREVVASVLRVKNKHHVEKRRRQPVGFLAAQQVEKIFRDAVIVFRLQKPGGPLSPTV